MVSGFNFIKEKGITMIEILVVILIISILIMILVFDFPKIQKSFSLSRATYKFTQDLRKTQDLAFSGEKKVNGVYGYGIFIDLRGGFATKYVIYADRGETPDQKYNPLNDSFCDELKNSNEDCILELVDLTQDAPGVAIKAINNTDNASYVSINFSPPNPTISITPGLSENNFRAEIVFGLLSEPKTSLNVKNVYIWKTGLIESRNN